MNNIKFLNTNIYKIEHLTAEATLFLNVSYEPSFFLFFKKSRLFQFLTHSGNNNFLRFSECKPNWSKSPCSADYCRMLNFRKNFITRVSRGSLDSPKLNSPNIIIAYENRMPDVTLAKFKYHKHQTNPNHQLKCSPNQLKCSPTLSILQYNL